MSFDINIINRNLSNVQATAKSQDGGAGNTGYFTREQDENEQILYLKDSNVDIFDKKTQKEEKEEDIDLLKLFLRFIERLLFKIKIYIHKNIK